MGRAQGEWISLLYNIPSDKHFLTCRNLQFSLPYWNQLNNYASLNHDVKISSRLNIPSHRLHVGTFSVDRQFSNGLCGVIKNNKDNKIGNKQQIYMKNSVTFVLFKITREPFSKDIVVLHKLKKYDNIQGRSLL